MMELDAKPRGASDLHDRLGKEMAIRYEAQRAFGGLGTETRSRYRSRVKARPWRRLSGPGSYSSSDAQLHARGNKLQKQT